MAERGGFSAAPSPGGRPAPSQSPTWSGTQPLTGLSSRSDGWCWVSPSARGEKGTREVMGTSASRQLARSRPVQFYLHRITHPWHRRAPAQRRAVSTLHQHHRQPVYAPSPVEVEMTSNSLYWTLSLVQQGPQKRPSDPLPSRNGPFSCDEPRSVWLSRGGFLDTSAKRTSELGQANHKRLGETLGMPLIGVLPQVFGPTNRLEAGPRT